jgi:hypothetical protein
LRHTAITNAAGDIVASVTWNGRRPKVILGDEKVGALTDLFGSSTVRFMYGAFIYLILSVVHPLSGQKYLLFRLASTQSMCGPQRQTP